MQSTLSLTLDLTTKKGFFTDITDYAAINVDVANLGAMGSVQVYFQGTLVDTLPINLGGVPSLRVSTEFDLELDVNGEVANGSYSAVYSVGYNFTTSCQISAANTIKVLTYGDNVLGFPAGAGITISGAPSVTSTIVSATDSGTNSLDIVIASSSLTPGLPINKTITVAGFETGNFSWVYAGCNMVESKASLVADCDYGDFGTFTVSNETNLEGVTLQSLTVDINYPSWTNEATITQTVLPFTQNNLATGTYSVELTQQIEKVQNDGLIINYEATCIQEFKVTCSGSLCGLNECIENLRKAHEAELLKNKVSKYQVYVDNILVYYMEAQNYKACGEMDKYRAEIAKIEAQLDASGCDCGCCDEDQYKWVQNTSANAIDIIASIEQLQDDVYAIDNSITIIQGDVSALQANAVLTADNGLTKTANNLTLGGTLTANTQIGLSSNQFDFYSNTGTLQFSKNQINAPASTRAVQIKSVKNGGAFVTGQGPAIDFSVGPSNSNTVIGSISSTWNNVGTDAIMGFDVYDTSFATTKFKIYGNNGVLEAPGYGQGNLVNNSPQYFLGVLSNGEFVEIDPASVGATASNGLTKTSGDIKLGGALTETTTSIIGGGGTTFNLEAQIISFSSNNAGVITFQNSGGGFESHIFGANSYPLSVFDGSNPSSVRDTNYIVVNASGTPTQGFGERHETFLSFDGNNNVNAASSIETTWINDPNTGRTAGYDIQLRENPTTISSVFQIHGTGQVIFKKYGQGNITGTPTYNLGVDATGNVIEVGPLVYVATLNQSGTSDPLVTEIHNTTGATMSIIRILPGVYRLTASSPVFTASKTAIFFSAGNYGNTAPYITTSYNTSTTVIILGSSAGFSVGSGSDDLLKNASLKIEIYP